MYNGASNRDVYVVLPYMFGLSFGSELHESAPPGRWHCSSAYELHQLHPRYAFQECDAPSHTSE